MRSKPTVSYPRLALVAAVSTLCLRPFVRRGRAIPKAEELGYL